MQELETKQPQPEDNKFTTLKDKMHKDQTIVKMETIKKKD